MYEFCTQGSCLFNLFNLLKLRNACSHTINVIKSTMSSQYRVTLLSNFHSPWKESTTSGDNKTVARLGEENPSKRTTIFFSFINFMNHHIDYILYSIILLYSPTLTSLLQLLIPSQTQAYLSPAQVPRTWGLKLWKPTLLLSCKCAERIKGNSSDLLSEWE